MTNRVLIQDGVAIKYGQVTRQEVANQRRAYQILDSNIVQVPFIYRYFTSEGTDYLVMEYVAVQGWKVDDDTLGAITEAVRHLHSFTRAWPGPACGGEYASTLWPQDDPKSTSTRDGLEEYVNSRLAGTRTKISFGDLPLVFTHGDLSPRNILFTAEGMWFIDWEFSGYFPRTTEIAVLRQDRADSNDD
ncbi:hypothetical protein LTS16_026938, partial [Friedmanniomyces endolithicus]